jgi:hypothetical protein
MLSLAAASCVSLSGISILLFHATFLANVIMLLRFNMLV